MNSPELERLRAANPVPTDPGAPPIEPVLALIEPADARTGAGGGQISRNGRGNRLDRKMVRSLAGAAGAVTVVAVIVAVVVVVAAGHHRPHAKSAAIPSFAGGMPGRVATDAAGFSGNTGFVSLVQCIGCHGEIIDKHHHTHVWWVTTTNGGATWSAERQRLGIIGVSWTGETGWAEAVDYRHAPRRLPAHVLVTHDGGRTWTDAGVRSSDIGYSISVADGVVWAVASGCGSCSPVLRGPASGSRLTAVPTTPHVKQWGLQIVAVSSTSAYLFGRFGGGPRRAWVTDDGGRSWRQVTRGCSAFTTVGDGHGAIWSSCAPSNDGRHRLGISTDGGRSWVYRSAPFSTGVLYPYSARVAWAQAVGAGGGSGATLRTDDGGRTWHTVWTPSPGFRRPPVLSVQSATVATEVVPVGHRDRRDQPRTNLLVYHTSDGGAHWDRFAVALPDR